MNRKDGKHHFTLTLMFASVILCILLVTFFLAGAVIFALANMGILPLRHDIPATKVLVVFMAIISLIIGMVVTVIMGNIPLKPFHMLIDKMNKLASGDFKVRVQFSGLFGNTSKAAELSDSFNKMAEELENTEILRSEFINNFSHEFKTPIVSIAGFAKLLKRGNLTRQQQEEYLNIIEEESLRLSYMATNILNLTRVESQKILTAVTRFNLSEQIRSSVLLLENKWEKKGISFRLEFGEYEITANEELLKQVWINLLDNAIKFSPEAGNISVEITENSQNIYVSVINSGNEISEENKTKIFNKFYQADESHSSEGNGIGLAIVKKIIELHRGKVHVESMKGKITFTVELPQ